MKNRVTLASAFLLAMLLVPASRAGVVCQLNVGGQPANIVYDSVNARAFVSLFAANEVYVLSHGCGVQHILGTGNNPNGMAFDGTNLWVALNGSNAVEKINLTTFAATTYPVGTGPRGVAFDGTYIWVTNEGSNTVTKLLASNGFNAGTFSVGSHPWGVAVNNTNGLLTIWVANLSSSSISVLNQNGVLQRTVATASEPQWFTSSTLYNGTIYGGDMLVSCYTSRRVERFSYQGALIASYSTSGNPTGTSASPAGVYGAAHNGTIFLITNGGTVTSESVGGNNYCVAYDINSDTEWMTDVNQGIIYELVY
jgi:YVTN family beta-propeller protein